MDLALVGFRSWLCDQGIAPDTAVVYASHLRAFFRTGEQAKAWVEGPPIDLHRAARSYEATLRSGAHGGFRTAFRAFLRYSATKGLDLNPTNDLIFPDRRRNRIFTGKPPAKKPENETDTAPLGEILRMIEKTDLPFKRIPEIFWRDIRPSSEGMTLVLDPAHENAHYMVPTEAIHALGYWASGGLHRPKPDQPLVPTAPKSMAPMATRRLRRIARLG